LMRHGGQCVCVVENCIVEVSQKLPKRVRVGAKRIEANRCVDALLWSTVTGTNGFRSI
jgi:hypothetical protein